MFRGMIAAIVVLLLGGCAMGVKHNFEETALNIAVPTKATVGVSAIDSRSYVTNGQKDPNFVGLSRGGFGNPFDVRTQSGRPLVSDMASTIASSMSKNGVSAKAVETKATASLDQAKTALRAANTQRSVLLDVQEWKADSLVNVGLTYRLALYVLDPQGNVLTTRTQQGSENLGAGAPFQPGGAELVLPRFQRMMELLFADPAVQKALQL